MAYFQTKNPDLGKFLMDLLSILLSFGLFYGYWVYFVGIWYILWFFGIFFPVLAPKKIWQPWTKETLSHDACEIVCEGYWIRVVEHLFS
jgi:hypothetical protein